MIKCFGFKIRHRYIYIEGQCWILTWKNTKFYSLSRNKQQLIMIISETLLQLNISAHSNLQIIKTLTKIFTVKILFFVFTPSTVSPLSRIRNVVHEGSEGNLHQALISSSAKISHLRNILYLPLRLRPKIVYWFLK